MSSVERHFDTLAPTYDRLRAPSASLDALVTAGDLRGRRMLDVGCGTGWTLRALATNHGLDEALLRLRGRCSSAFALMEEDEIRSGIERAERILPDPVRHALHLLFVSGLRGGE